MRKYFADHTSSRILLVMGTLITYLLFFHYGKTSEAARYWCHDYTLQFVNGKKTIGTKAHELRKALRNKCDKAHYKLVSYSGLKSLEQTKLNPGDIVIIGSMHSGVVQSGGRINHFFGETYREVGVKSWSISQFHNFRRTKNVATGKPLSKPLYSFRNKPVQVWKKMSSNVTEVKVEPIKATINVNESLALKARAVLNEGRKVSVTDHAVWSPGNLFTGTHPGTFTVSAICGGVTGSATVTVKPGQDARLSTGKNSVSYYLIRKDIHAKINGVPCKTTAYYCSQATAKDLNWLFKVYRNMFFEERQSADVVGNPDSEGCVRSQKILDLKQSVKRGPSRSPITVPRPSTNCPCSNTPTVQYQLSQEYDPRCSSYNELQKLKKLLQEM
jgi:hypothetical protein